MDNVNLQEKVIQWVESAASKINDFATEQIPPFIHEYLTWKFWEAAFGASLYVFCLIPLGVYLHQFKRFWKWGQDESYNSSGFTVFLFCLVTICVCGITIAAFPYDDIKDMIQISIAPKVYLMEKAAELIKK